MKVTMLATAQFLQMGVIVKLGISHMIKDVASGIVIPLKKGFDLPDNLVNEIISGNRQNAVTFNDVFSRDPHGLKPFGRYCGKINRAVPGRL
jgi:hypothetical protein